MLVDFNFMACGEAGQGVQSIGWVFAKTMSYGGFHVFADQDYENRVRGGHNFFRVRVSDKKILTFAEKLDILIALHEDAVALHKKDMKENGVIIFDRETTHIEDESDLYLHVPLSQLAEETTNNTFMVNTVALGAAFGLTGCDFEILKTVLQKEFQKAGEEIVKKNVAAVRAGFEFTFQKGIHKVYQKTQPERNPPKKMFLNGNEALALGAMVGGCKFISGYPMTPATPILEYIADKGVRWSTVAMHVEDEIAAINMALGASFAGVRAMVATSGGGFSLMVEGISLAGITETPVVVVLGQRPGPATGLPTRTEQGDLHFALRAGHGEFPRALLAPATVEGSFHAIIKAFNLAENYQIPVIILTDHHLMSSYTIVERFCLEEVFIEREGVLSDKEIENMTDYKRHLNTESGISPRAFPLQGKALVITDSDEHDETGHMAEDVDTRNQQNMKRLRKLKALSTEIGEPYIEQIPKAEYTLIGWGSTYGAIKEATDILRQDGMAVNMLHFTEIWPFPAEEATPILHSGAKNIVIENNATAQFAHLIKSEIGHEVSRSILKFDGYPFSASHIVDQLKKEVS